MARVFLALGVMLALFFFLLGWLMSTPANAQMQSPDQRQVLCGPRRQLLDSFKATHGQKEQWVGKAGQDGVLVLLGDKNGNWSLFVVQPDVACLLGSGDGSTLLFGDPV